MLGIGGLGLLVITAALSSFPKAPAPPAKLASLERRATALPARRVEVIPDDDVIVGSPDITMVARSTLHFVRRVQAEREYVRR